MLQLFAFFVLVMPAFVSAKDQDVANAPNNCEVNNYNNNFYAGPDKRVESLLRDMKTQLDELQRQVALLAKCRKPDTKEINVCESNPCLNNGTCTVRVHGFNCSCSLGFAGVRCETDFSSTMNGWLAPVVRQNSGLQWKLCYRASVHGWAASTFHSRCDGKRNTVTIIKTGPYVFGGYTDIPWEHGGKYGATSKAFIFSLRNKEGLDPFKSTARHPGRHSIGRFPGFGPTFGHGHDIYIADNANSNNKSYTNFGHHKDFHVPSAVQDRKTVLAGTYHFTPDEVEVFYLG